MENDPKNDQKNQRAWPFSKPLEFLQKVKYGGVVGKLTAIAVAALLVVAVTMVSAWGNELVHLAGLGIIFALVFAAYWRIAKTLEKHPELALLEGAEFIKYRQIELAAKNVPVLPTVINASPIPDPLPPTLPKEIEGPEGESEEES